MSPLHQPAHRPPAQTPPSSPRPARSWRSAIPYLRNEVLIASSDYRLIRFNRSAATCEFLARSRTEADDRRSPHGAPSRTPERASSERARRPGPTAAPATHQGHDTVGSDLLQARPAIRHGPGGGDIAQSLEQLPRHPEQDVILKLPPRPTARAFPLAGALPGLHRQELLPIPAGPVTADTPPLPAYAPASRASLRPSSPSRSRPSASTTPWSQDPASSSRPHPAARNRRSAIPYQWHRGLHYQPIAIA